ncbi:hypothetical protein N7481_007788 [Penicillium waksmanii]|uniref:uncharacterized protein n=1 Tax=Penicillium waksmanii TaxID=69791 RepID=UPI002548D9C9|nr:uncharacterized protein N7481_007788 [Penicillium waksmanii]KAJ5980490.1 hypothetical protein N7481_007788 [Penicillium waksmanii]
MDSLPVEIKHIICRFVKADSHQDLSSVSRINHAWYNTAAPFVYDTLSIAFHNDGSLPTLVSEVSNHTHGEPFLKYARRLDIVCLPDPSRKTTKALQIRDVKNRALQSIDFRSPASVDTFLEHRLKRCHDQVLPFLATESVYYRERNWKPLVSLIAQLERLTELNYVIQNIFPTELFAVLNQYHPRCRLNVWTHQSLNLNLPDYYGDSYPGPPSKFNDPFDLNVLRSSQLHAFSMYHSRPPTLPNGLKRAQLTETLLFALTAANLKHLSFQDLGCLTTEDMLRVKEKWQELSLTGNFTPRASLDSLSFDAHPPMSPWEEVLSSMSQLVDLSQLRSLEIGVYNNPAILKNVASELHGLERLYINMHPWKLHHEDIHADDEQMVAAVQAFRPLRYLCLEGLRSFTSLREILSQHGNSLKGLLIQSSTHMRRISNIVDTGFKYPLWTAGQITEISQSCPNVEELCLPIQRSEGSPRECGLYKELGSFSKLHTLVLDLHYDPRERPITPWPIEPATEPDILRRTFSNAAVDEVLVSKIWHLISSNQSSRRLKNLRITPVGMEFFDKLEQQILGQLGRSFLVQPPRVGEVKVEIQEIGRIAWELWWESQVGDDEESTSVPKPVELVLRELWPHTHLERGLIKGWHSLSLQDWDIKGSSSSSSSGSRRKFHRARTI